MTNKKIRKLETMATLILLISMLSIISNVSAVELGTIGITDTEPSAQFAEVGYFFASPFTSQYTGDLGNFTLVTKATDDNAYVLVSVYDGFYGGVSDTGSGITSRVSTPQRINIPNSGTYQTQSVRIDGSVISGHTYYLMVYGSHATLMIKYVNLGGNGTGGSPSFNIRSTTYGLGDGTFTNDMNSSVLFPTVFNVNSSALYAHMSDTWTMDMDFSPWGSSGSNGYSPEVYTQMAYVTVNEAVQPTEEPTPPPTQTPTQTPTQAPTVQPPTVKPILSSVNGELTANTTQIDWGQFNITSSCAVNITYHGNETMLLNFTMVSPHPANLSEYVTLMTDYDGIPLLPNETRTITFTAVKSDLALSTDFSFGINVNNLLLINTATLTTKDLFEFFLACIIIGAIILGLILLVMRKLWSV